jgi:hypothetical protein
MGLLSACQVVEPHGTVLDTLHKFTVGKTTYAEATAAMQREVNQAKFRDATSALGAGLAGDAQTHAERTSVMTVPGINGGTRVLYTFAESENSGLFVNKNGSVGDALTVTLDFGKDGILTSYDTSSQSQY